MPYAGASPTLTVQVLLNQPELVSRALVNLVNKRLVADKLFVRGTAEQVAGGAMRYQQLESIYVDDDPVEIAEGADFPFTDYAETVLTEPVKQYGYSHRVTNLAIRRNQRDTLARGLRKLSNRIVRFIDSKSMAVLENAALGIQTNASAALWTNAATDIIAEIAEAQEMIEVKDNGYAGFDGATLVLHTKRRDDLLNNTALRSALPRETTRGQIQTGQIAPFLGVKEIIFTPQITETVGILLDTGIAGTIADEVPDASEGWVTDSGLPAGFAPIYVKIEDDGKPAVHKRISAGRWPAIVLPEPQAVVKITGIA